MPETITYDSLYEALRKEKFSTELQKLPIEFFKNVVNYLQEKSSIIESQKTKDNLFVSEVHKTQTQLNNVIRIIKELYERRENKIIQLAIFSSKLKQNQDTSSMLPEEQRLYNSALEVIDNYRRIILDNLISRKLPEIKEEPKGIKTEDKESNILIRTMHPIPKFVGTDLFVYGPFEQDDVANMPEKIANLLIERKRAEEIKA